MTEKRVAFTSWVQRVMLDDAPMRDDMFESQLRRAAAREGYELAGPVTWKVLEPLEPFREEVVKWTEAGYVFVRAEAPAAPNNPPAP